MQYKFSLIVSFLVILLGCIQPTAQASGHFEEGIKHFNEGRYLEAVLFFGQATGEYPGSAVAHYYLASSLVKAKLHEQAIEEYQFCYRLDPYGSLARYCRQALCSYRQPLLENQTTKLVRCGEATALLVHDSILARGKSTDNLESLNRAKSVIRRQADSEKSKHQQIGENWAKNAVNQAERDAKKITEEAREEIQKILEAPSMSLRNRLTPGIGSDAELAKQRAEDVRKAAEEAASRTKLLAEARAGQYRQWYKERQSALEEVVSNLESQLEEPAGHSGVKLQPIGTDLYVRYYGFSRAQNELPDVHPAVLRIVGQRGDPQSLDVGGNSVRQVIPNVTKSVRGKMIF